MGKVCRDETDSLSAPLVMLLSGPKEPGQSE